MARASQSKKPKPAKGTRALAPPRARFYSRRDLWLALAVAAAALVAFLPALRAGFVWDDDAITENGVLDGPHALRTIWLHPTANAFEEHYWPMTYTTFLIERSLWGKSPFGYHLVNMLLHGANAALIGLLLRRLRAPGAWAAAALFGLHPVHVESVAWAVERKDVLSGFFFLAAFLAFVDFDARRGEPRARIRYALSLGLFALAMLSKSAAAGLPIALALYLWAAPRDEAANASHSGAARWKPLLPFFAAAIALAALDVGVVRSREAALEIADYGPRGAQRIVVAGRALWLYLGKILWPIPQSTIYPKWALPSGLSWMYLFPLALAAAAPWLLLAPRGRRATAACLVYFAAMLGPVLGFLDFSFMQHSFVADRFQYLASAGIIALAAAAGAGVAGRAAIPSRLRAGALGALLFALGAATWVQAAAYRNIETLFARTIRTNPRAWAAHYNLANHLSAQGDHNGAMREYRKTAELNPRHASSLLNWGNSLASLKRYDEAIQLYGMAQAINPKHPRIYNNTALALLQSGRVEPAIEQLEKALALDPNYESAKKNLANARAYVEKMRGKKPQEPPAVVGPTR